MNIAIILTFFVVLLSIVLIFVFSRKKTSTRTQTLNNNGNAATTKTKNSPQRNIPSVNKQQQATPKKKGFTPPGSIHTPPKEPKQVIIEKKLEENVGEEVKPAMELRATEENEFKKHYIATKFDKLQPENSSGNIQYFMISKIQDENHLKTLLEQVKFRVSQGNGDALYAIGVSEDGTPVGFSEPDLMNSIGILRLIADQAFATAKIIRIRDASEGKYAAELFVRKRSDGEMYSEVRIAVCGNVDVGKSTLLGVLSRGALDNGRGRARLNIFKHKHEIETGRTSDIGREILGFNNDGDIVNYAGARAPTWSEICEKSSKVVMFMDLAGHEKYLKTTVFGLTGNYPDYTMLMVGSNMGVIGMTKEHYHLTLALKVPCFIVVTKIDMCPPNVLESTLTVLKKMLKAPGSKKIPIIIGNADDVVLAARNFNSDRMTPVFQVSNVTGAGLDLLKLFINLISPRKDWDKLKFEPTVFHLDNTFSVPGVGTVVSGTLMKGTININQTLLLGPDEFGKFKPILVKGIHTNRLSVKTAYAGQSVSIALKKINRSQTRKGQVMTAPELNPKAVWEFDAEIFVITHSTTISTNYEAVIHCGCTRQTATIVEIQGVLRANARGKVRFRYKYRPEYIEEGDRIIFREGRTKGIGNVVGLYYDVKSERTKSRKEKKEELTQAHQKPN